jgi:hypothetical protein
MPPIQVRVNPLPNTNLPDSTAVDMLGGKSGEGIVAELHGKYFTQNYRGNLFYASLTSATALVAPATNATPNFALWNPAGNNTALSLVRASYGYVSGTPAAGVIGYQYVPYAGSTIGGTSAVSAFTALTVRSCIVGKGYAGNVLAGTAATITGAGIAAEVTARYTGISQGVLGSASIPPGLVMNDEFDGTMIVPPGYLWFPVCSAASVATYMISAIWEEIPWP